MVVPTNQNSAFRGKTSRPLRTRAEGYRAVFLLGLLLGLLVWNGYWTIRHFIAEAHCNTVLNSTLNRDQNPPAEQIERAIWWDRHNAEYWYKLARALLAVRSDVERAIDEEEASRDQAHIVSALEEAVRLNPFQTRYHLLLGWEYSHLCQDSDTPERWLAAADQAMDRAAYFAGDKDHTLHLNMANYWIMRSKGVVPSNPMWEIAWAKASGHYRKAQSLAQSEDLKGEIEAFVWKFYPDKEMISDLLLSQASQGAS